MRCSEFTKVSLAVPCAVILLTGAATMAWGQQQQPQQTQQPRTKAAASTPPTAAQPAGRGQPAGQPNARPQSGNGGVIPAAGQAAPKPQRPAAADLVLEELPPELEELLQEWEAKSAKIKTLHGKHTRVIYNNVFEVEKIAEGKFYLETPDKGRIDLIGIKPQKGEVSKRIGQNGEPFKLESDRPEKWICNGKAIIAVNEVEKTYEVVPIPPEHQGANIVNSPLPFLFGMKAQDMKRRFRIELNKNYKRKDKTAYLVVFPRQEIDRQNYTEARILLDTTTFLPKAVKLLDETSHLETVYQFNVEPAANGILQKIFPEQDPFNPSFKKDGYKLVLSQAPPVNQQPLPADVRAKANSAASEPNSRPTNTAVRGTSPK